MNASVCEMLSHIRDSRDFYITYDFRKYPRRPDSMEMKSA